MTVALVHADPAYAIGSGGSIFPAHTPTPGNLMVVIASSYNHGGPSSIAGWTIVSPGVLTVKTGGHVYDADHAMFYRVAQPGDSHWTASASLWICSYSEWSGVGSLITQVDALQASPTAICGGPITVSGAALLIGGWTGHSNGDAVSTAPDSGVTELTDPSGSAPTPSYWSGYRVVTAGTYTIGGTVTFTAPPYGMAGITAAFDAAAAPIADFTANHTSGVVPDSIGFTDLSSNGPTSWAWTFGDGATSTSQNPSHTYTVSGVYTVCLTVTNSFGSDSVCKVSYVSMLDDVGYSTPGPGGALIEIYVREPGAATWDDATWDDAVWSVSGWQDVTPQSIEANVTWGSSQAELGILAQPDADSWEITFYDPDRLLDPANVDGPYYGDLRPNMPVRINHGTRGHGLVNTIRTGLIESLSHSFSGGVPSGMGQARVTNLQSTYANAQVPHDTTLDDTLFARARSALSAAGLPVKVLPDPAVGDPALVAWLDTGDDQSVWSWISDAAQSVLWVPYFDKDDYLGFRDYRNPVNAGVALDATRLINLMSTVAFNGLFARVLVTDDTLPTAVVIERFTATEYGLRTYTRSNPTPNASDWAEAVLEDRTFTTLRWIPGELYPLTHADVNAFGGVNGTEVVTITDLFTDPAVNLDAIVVGGSFRITAKRDDNALWWFTFNTAQASGISTPLAEDGSSPPEYLYRDGGVGTLLFPDQ